MAAGEPGEGVEFKDWRHDLLQGGLIVSLLRKPVAGAEKGALFKLRHAKN
jgi:hypothetical protein